MKARRVLLISLVGCLGLFCILCACSLGFVRMALPVFKMEGHSMAPALSAGDLLLVNPWAYQQHMPERGDVIVLRDPDEGRLLTKRVIGLPDEEVAILDGQVFIDGTVLYEPNIDQPRRGGSGGSLRVPKDEVFVLGDNRNNSADSRHYGPVPLDNIVGKIVFVVSPQRMYLMPKVSYSTPGTGP